MIREGEQVNWLAATKTNKRKSRLTEQALAFGLGVLSFAGWAGSLALDGTIFRHNALGSLLVHPPLMLLPAALVLGFGLPRLPERERTMRRIIVAWALVIMLTAPALAPGLVPAHSVQGQQAIVFLVLLWVRVPIYGLGLALALVDPDLQVGSDRQELQRLPPKTVALAFALCTVGAGIILFSIPQPPPPPNCRCLGPAFGEAIRNAVCGFSVVVALVALLGASVAYGLGAWIRGRWQLRQRAGAI